MAKLAVVFWSGTGNTEEMAKAVLRGAESENAQVELFDASSFSIDLMDDFDGIAFGCPAMGAEELEDSEFEPMFSSIESKLDKKRISLFGSYDWGDGEWMRTWEEDCRIKGAIIVSESVICYLEPDDEAIEACENLGRKLAK